MTEGAQVDVVEDLSAYVISGAVSAVQCDADYESDRRTPTAARRGPGSRGRRHRHRATGQTGREVAPQRGGLMMTTTAQRLCAWSGIACLVIFLVGFGPIAGF